MGWPVLENKNKFQGFFSSLSIRAKILLSSLSVLFLVMAALITLTLNGNRKLVLQVSNSEIVNFAHLSAEAMGFGLQTLNFEYIRNIINRMKQEPRLSSLLILDNDSRVIAGLNETRLKGVSVEGLLNSDKPSLRGDKICWAHLIKGYDPATLREQVLGTVVVEFSLDSVNDKILHQQIQFVMIACSVLVAGIIISFLLARQISSPVAQLARVSSQVAHTGDYRLRAEKKTGGELGLLIDQYNEMLARIQKQDDDMRRLNESLELRVQERTRDLEAAKEEAESGNRAKNDFLSRMSHEIRTPLNAILGFGQLLKIKGWEVSREHREKNEKFVDHILNASNHLKVLIDEILDLSQVESGRFSIQQEKVELAGILGDIKSVLLPIAQSHKTQINCDLASARDMPVYADPRRVKQVLFNLVSNAIKYNHPGGEVDVWAEKKDAGRVMLKVRDTGPGIPADKAELVFEPFERLDWELCMVEGIGIGLSISKKLVEAMGGEIGLQSTQGKWSVFYFTLALYRQSVFDGTVDTSFSGQDAAGNASRFSLLYVEDNPDNRELVKDIIESVGGYELICAETAEEGIEKARANGPDLIILDIQLPGMSGLEAVQVLRSDERTRDIPVIALSAFAEQQDIERALQAGFRDYLTKPVGIHQFLNVLKKYQPDRFPGPHAREA